MINWLNRVIFLSHPNNRNNSKRSPVDHKQKPADQSRKTRNQRVRMSMYSVTHLHLGHEHHQGVKMSKPKFAQITIEEMGQLMIKKPPASAIAVYISLVSHDLRGTGSVFPRIIRMAENLKISDRQVYRGLAWLRENGFVKQGSCRSQERFILVLRHDISDMETCQPGQENLTNVTGNPDISDKPDISDRVEGKEPCQVGQSNMTNRTIEPDISDIKTCQIGHHKRERKENEETINYSIAPYQFVESPKSEPQASIKIEKDWIPEKPKQNGSPKCPSGIPQDVFDWVRVCSPVVATAKICHLTPLRKNPDIEQMLEKYPPPKNVDPSCLPRLVKSPGTIQILMRLMI